MPTCRGIGTEAWRSWRVWYRTCRYRMCCIERVDIAPCGMGNYEGVEGSDLMAEGVDGEK